MSLLVAAEDYKWRVGMIYRNLLAEELVSGLNGPELEALQFVGQGYASIGHMVDRLTAFGSQAVDMPPAQACVVLDGTVGRPSFQISPTQLEFFYQQQIFCSTDSSLN